MKNNIQVCFVNAEQPPISVRHICYFTSQAFEIDEINLNEVYEATYPHPDAPDTAIVYLTTTRLVKTVKRSDYQGAHILLMEAQQKACRYVEVRG